MGETVAATAIQRLNWECGEHPPPGWINVDKIEGPGIAISGDIRDGLPLPDDSIDFIVSIHAVQDLPYLGVVPALREFRRVLKPGSVLRLGLPARPRYPGLPAQSGLHHDPHLRLSRNPQPLPGDHRTRQPRAGILLHRGGEEW